MGDIIAKAPGLIISLKEPSSQPGLKQETMLRSWSEYRYKQAPTHYKERAAAHDMLNKTVSINQ